MEHLNRYLKRFGTIQNFWMIIFCPFYYYCIYLYYKNTIIMSVFQKTTHDQTQNKRNLKWFQNQSWHLGSPKPWPIMTFNLADSKQICLTVFYAFEQNIIFGFFSFYSVLFLRSFCLYITICLKQKLKSLII